MQELKIRVNQDLADNKTFGTFLEALPRTFNYIGEEIHRGRNVLKTINARGLNLGIDSIMVKRYHGLFWFQKLDYTYFRSPKCRKAFENTAELRRRGFDSARELATVEVWNHGLFQYAFFVSEVAEGEKVDSQVIAMNEHGEQARVEVLIRQYAALVVRLHEHGVLYWDMNCGNVLCREEHASDGNTRWHFTLIDTNRVRLYPEDQVLDLDTVIGDLILMNPKMGTVEMFIEEYLRQRGLYTHEEAQRIRQVQYERYEKKKHRLKTFIKRFRKQYYKWL